MYNPNYYNNFPQNNYTFHDAASNLVPPPPLPPNFYIPPTPLLKSQISDQDFVKSFEKNITLAKKPKSKTISINEVKEKLRNLVLSLKYIKDKEAKLRENMSTLPDSEWTATMEEIEENKFKISDTMSQINDLYLNTLKKLLTKRSAKRLRLKRLHMERKKEKEARLKKLAERSRKIDENLQKIVDDINKAIQEEEAKLQADIILKEVLRKKQDAKKYITKLDALMKLRKARQNTAKGRGENVSERDAVNFNNNIEKLKSLWVQKLSMYEKEESELRAKLNQNTVEQTSISNEKEKKALENLRKWREFLFGRSGACPQNNFQGDIGKFVANRAQWDQFISCEGTPLPVGWVVPDLRS